MKGNEELSCPECGTRVVTEVPQRGARTKCPCGAVLVWAGVQRDDREMVEGWMVAVAPCIFDPFGEAADALSAVLVDAEEALRRFRVDAQVRLGAHDHLMYGKRSGRWGLFIRGPGGEQDVLTSSVETRMRVVRLLPVLLQELRSRSQHRVEEIRAVVQLGRDFIATMGDE